MSKEKIKIAVSSETPSTQELKVGMMLQEGRIKKKQTIEEVAEILRIKPAYLIAIEESDYKNIPKAPYGIGFIRSYASHLGLNCERITQIYKEETSEPSLPPIPATPTLPEETPIENEETMSLNYKYIGVSVVLLVLCYLLWIVITPNNNTTETSLDNEINSVEQTKDQEYPLQVENYTEETENTIENSPAEEIEQITITNAVFEEETDKAQPEENKSEKNKIEESISPKPDSSELKTETKPQTETIATPEQKTETVLKPQKTGRVVLKIKKETWVEVKDENKLWISKVLHAGDEYVLPENGVGKTVSFGNTDGVDVIIDGKIVTVVSNNKKTNINMDAFLGAH